MTLPPPAPPRVAAPGTAAVVVLGTGLAAVAAALAVAEAGCGALLLTGPGPLGGPAPEGEGPGGDHTSAAYRGFRAALARHGDREAALRALLAPHLAEGRLGLRPGPPPGPGLPPGPGREPSTHHCLDATGNGHGCRGAGLPSASPRKRADYDWSGSLGVLRTRTGPDAGPRWEPVTLAGIWPRLSAVPGPERLLVRADATDTDADVLAADDRTRWARGEAAGAVAAFCVRADTTAERIAANPQRLLAVQCALLGRGVPLHPAPGLADTHPAFAAAHLLALHGGAAGPSVRPEEPVDDTAWAALAAAGRRLAAAAGLSAPRAARTPGATWADACLARCPPPLRPPDRPQYRARPDA